MDKKDIYEHLAKIYLDASSNKKKKSAAQPRIFKNTCRIYAFFCRLFYIGGNAMGLARRI